LQVTHTSNAELTVRVDEDRIAAAHIDSVNAGDERRDLISLVANANGASVTAVTEVADNNVVVAGVEVEARVKTEGNVVAAVVEEERGFTNGRV
jgi:uncharacterized secreted protein with C-terminal beta-propeller domain